MYPSDAHGEHHEGRVHARHAAKWDFTTAFHGRLAKPAPHLMMHDKSGSKLKSKYHLYYLEVGDEPACETLLNTVKVHREQQTMGRYWRQSKL